MRYASRCGVRASAQALAQRAGLMRQMFAMATPDDLVRTLADSGAGRRRPAFLFVRRHAGDRPLGARRRRRPITLEANGASEVTTAGRQIRQADKSRSQTRSRRRLCVCRHDPKQPRPSIFSRRSASGPLQLPNRLVMAPMTRNRAGPGEVPGPIQRHLLRPARERRPDRHRRHAGFAAGPRLCRHAGHFHARAGRRLEAR